MSTPKESPIKHVLYVIFGGLIGLAEMVPGVSGGTVALVVGIYERAIRNGDALLHTIRTAITDRSKLKEAASKVEWFFLAAVAVGMIGTVLALSSVMHSFVEEHPETSRALFMGMVAVSILVPLNMIRSDKLAQHRVGAYIAFVLAAIATFLLTGVTSAEKTDPSLLVVFFAAMIAVCALVLPGVSGSFILLSLGLYSPVMGAVADRDLKVMAVFALGALLGVALFIKLLDYLITTHRTITLATMAGLMLGSLRALWPWQTDQAELLSPSGNVGWIVFMVILGGAIVGAIMAAEKFSSRR
ncbi:DUF368 domain-containing protein [Corynebacterium pseudopelargi]|uniref:DUF368 domain-containing protein n=1 Tax=Corynebacterium pseudopelargi TaxID=2080757 RepID=A0A3G6IUN4_9CORY|nr:DUF368 domain-containing protein [Corynebacterium pseudopelargi]AZA09392.1 hypothetical protein CPPEL_06390 [Corynebacterium pseudopelargi]